VYPRELFNCYNPNPENQGLYKKLRDCESKLFYALQQASFFSCAYQIEAGKPGEKIFPFKAQGGATSGLFSAGVL